MWRGHSQDIFNNVSNLTDKHVEDRINFISAHHITTPGDIEEALNDLKSGKCAGLDNIQSEHQKNASNVLNVLLSIIVHGYVEAWIYCKYDFRNCDYTCYQEQVRGCH